MTNRKVLIILTQVYLFTFAILAAVAA